MIGKIGLILLIVLLMVSCGKKGPLQLEPELLPTEITNFELYQVGNSIKLQWAYPQKLKGKVKDKEKAKFLPENVREIRIYYSEKEILGGKFRKKSKLLRKLSAGDLTPVPLEMLNFRVPIQRKRSTFGSRQEEWRNLYFNVMVPFQLPQLDNKQHFFAVQYYYHKKRSPLGKVEMIRTVIPVKPVSGLKITNENKMIKLKWRRPENNMAGNPMTGIAGYNIFKKILPDPEKKTAASGQPQETEEAESGPPVFKRLNKNTVLNEYYEDTDTGTSGTYSYYITTAMTSIIESAPSREKSVKITDIFPPEVPANLVCFKTPEHMLLTWQESGDKDFSYYRIYRRTPRQREFSLIADNVTGKRYHDKGLRKGRLYIYVITAVDDKGNESEYSTPAQERF